MIITDLSAGKMALKFVQSEDRIFLNVAAPPHWSVGDTVAIEINRAPYPVAFDNESHVMFSLPKELARGWEKAFYRLRNERTQDISNLDFNGIRGWESFARDAKRRNPVHPANGKNKNLVRGPREL